MFSMTTHTCIRCGKFFHIDLPPTFLTTVVCTGTPIDNPIWYCPECTNKVIVSGSSVIFIVESDNKDIS